MRTILIIFTFISFLNAFAPSYDDYDTHGLRIAANQVLFVQAINTYPWFSIRFAPYDHTDSSLYCAVFYADYNHFFYTVAVGSKQNETTNSFFYFAGEVVSFDYTGTDFAGRNGTFIGIYINQDPQDVLYYSTNRLPIDCHNFAPDYFAFLSSYSHQEYFVIGVEPYGRYAIGLATDFVFRYEPLPNATIVDLPGKLIWPNNVTFYPCAVDVSETFTIVAGFVENSAQSRVRATPTVYLMSNQNLTVLHSWIYIAPANSWQSRLTYSSITTWKSQYTMTVKINPVDMRRVLVGMPFLNTVFMFVVENNGKTLRLTSAADHGQTFGYGKSVTWLSNSQAAVLDRTSSHNGDKYLSTTIHLYTSMNTDQISSKPTSFVPNSFQPIPYGTSDEWIRMVSTPSSLVVLDIYGTSFFLLAELPGFYPSTETLPNPTYSNPMMSRRAPCLAGTYKNEIGVHSCALCPTGTQNSDGTGAVKCFNCSSESFCPLGAVHEINSTALANRSQAYAYPKSPEMDVFEDILLHNMFLLTPDAHCLMVSPIFWTLILLAFVAILLLSMASMNLCVKPEKREVWRGKIKSIFQRTDLVGEGELWLGGLASLAVLLITAMAYNFAVSFMNQYPAEMVGPSNFACDPELRNAMYSSTLQSLALPISTVEQPMFDMLDDQNFTLQIGFLNTAIQCQHLSVGVIFESLIRILPLASCSNQNGTLNASFVASEHEGTFQIYLDTMNLVGGFRFGITGPGSKNGLYTLQDLNFHQTFTNPTRTLARSAKFELAVSKVVNETEPLSGGDSMYSGIWYPTYTYILNDLFVSAENYMKISATSITLTIVVSETTYYIKNVQSPIAKQAEIIFRTLLFALLCLELIAMAFLLCKLLLIPLVHGIYRCFHRQQKTAVEPFRPTSAD